MKILIVTTRVPPDEFGGAESTAKSYAMGLANLGHEVRFIGLHQWTLTKRRDESRAFDGPKTLAIRSMPSLTAKFLSGAKGVSKIITHALDHLPRPIHWKILAAATEFRADVAILHNLQGIGWGVIPVLSVRRIPTVLFLHDQGLICLNRGRFKNGRDCPTWCTACKLSTGPRQIAVQSASNITLMGPSRFIIDAVGEYFKIGRIECIVAPNPNLYPTLPRTDRDPAEFKILLVGRLSQEKGVEFAIQLVDQLNKASPTSLIIAGDGPLYSELKIKADASDADIEFKGYISHAEIARLLADCDVLLVPSLWGENFPGVVIHGLQAGAPVLASDVGGIPEIITHGVDGFLAPPNDANSWLKILETLRSDPHLRERLSREAVRSSGRFEPSRLLARFEGILRSISTKS